MEHRAGLVALDAPPEPVSERELVAAVRRHPETGDQVGVADRAQPVRDHDAVTERRINENLRGRDCTQIVVLDEGRVAEAGSHAELVARNGHYAALVDGQLERETPVG